MRLVWLVFLMLLVAACTGREVNYLQTSCDPFPRIEVVKRPPHPEPFEMGKACFVYLPFAAEKGREKALAGVVYAALKKQYLFRGLIWGGPLRYETLFKECLGADYLVTLESLHLEAANKVAPGTVALSLSVKRLRDENTIWLLTGAVDLCPRYPRDYTVFLTRSEPPNGRMDDLSSELYFLVRLLTSYLRG